MENFIYNSLPAYSYVSVYPNWTYSPFFGNIITYQLLQNASSCINQENASCPTASTYLSITAPQTLQKSQELVFQKKALPVPQIRNEKAKPKQIKKREEQEFTVKKTKSQKVVTYKKKNTEFNIVNQTFSYLNSQKSKQTVLRILQNDLSKTAEYYKLMTQIKKCNKKYINRRYLKELIEFSEYSKLYKLFLKSNLKSLTITDLRILVRSLIYYFFREQIYIPLLTSSKIFRQTLPEHFWRKRDIVEYLFNSNGQRLNEVS